MCINDFVFACLIVGWAQGGCWVGSRWLLGGLEVVVGRLEGSVAMEKPGKVEIQVIMAITTPWCCEVQG